MSKCCAMVRLPNTGLTPSQGDQRDPQGRHPRYLGDPRRPWLRRQETDRAAKPQQGLRNRQRRHRATGPDARSQNDDNKASANGYTYEQAYGLAGKSTYGGYGTPKTNLLTLGYNAELPIDDSLSLYSFTTYSRRKAEQGQNFRLPTITNTITSGPNGYPAGYTPPGTSTRTTSRRRSVARALWASGTGTCLPPMGATKRSRAPPITRTLPWAKPRRTASPPAPGFPPS